MKVADYGVDDYNEFAAHLAQYINDNAYYKYGVEIIPWTAGRGSLYRLIREFQESLI